MKRIRNSIATLLSIIAVSCSSSNVDQASFGETVPQAIKHPEIGELKGSIRKRCKELGAVKEDIFRYEYGNMLADIHYIDDMAHDITLRKNIPFEGLSGSGRRLFVCKNN